MNRYHARTASTLFLFLLAGTLSLSALDFSGMEIFHQSPGFIYYAETRADEDYSELIETMELRDIEFRRKFNTRLIRPVEIFVFRSQPSFAEHVFGIVDPEFQVTGLANHVDYQIYITSYHDGCKTKKRLLTTAVHELVHIYLPHSYIYIREGVACYFSDMIYPVTEEDIPRSFTEIRFYTDGPEETTKAYNASSWMMKFIYEECLDRDMSLFRNYLTDPENYPALGFNDEEAFFDDWGEYLRKTAVENPL